MNKILCKVLMMLFRLVEKPLVNDIVHVYFKKLGKIAKVKVSSVMMESFSARLVDEEDEELQDAYGQLDNDVKFYLDSREPIDKGEAK